MACMILGFLFVYHGAWLHALFAFITLGVLLPFFFINVYGVTRRRRQIFMGDTGSMTLGFSMSFLTISFAMNNHYIKPFSDGAIVVAFSTLIVPVLDVARVMYIRWSLGKPVFKPDRNHLHHLLLDIGLSHRATMVSIILLSVSFCMINMLTVEIIGNNYVILLDIIIWCLFIRSCTILKKKIVSGRVQLFPKRHLQIKSITNNQKKTEVSAVGFQGE